MGFAQDYSQLIEYWDIVHFNIIVSVSAPVEKLMGREKRKMRKNKNGFRMFSVIVSYIRKSVRI